MVWVFWVSCGFLAYVFAGFPVLLAVRAAGRRRQHRPDHVESLLPVSVIVAAHNEAEIIERKLDNLAELDYPTEHLEIIVASDGSDDGTNEIVQSYTRRPVVLLALPRGGKNRALNQAAAVATGQLLFFTDADTMLEPDALNHLVGHFGDAAVGGVTGDFRYTGGGDDPSGERSYWKVDRLWKRLQTGGGSVTSGTGQLYTIRRELFQTVPDGVSDDFFLSSGVVALGRTLVFEPRAIGCGGQAASVQAEYRRKVRVANQGLRGVWFRRRLLNPFQYGFYSLQLLTHKVLRRLVAIPLVLLAVSAGFLLSDGIVYQVVAIGQLALHGLALAGWFLRATSMGQSKLLRLPLFFDMASLAALIAAAQVASGRHHNTWIPDRS